MLATLARHEGLMKVGFGVFATTLIPAGAQLYRLSRFSCGPSPTTSFSTRTRLSRPTRPNFQIAWQTTVE